MSLITQRKHVLLAATALGVAYAGPAMAQDAADTDDEVIIVTAQRVEERLQDVPVSITYLDNETLANNNVTSARDLTSLTPGMTMNSRYGNDATTFTIRGFTQELRTTPTVGVYFADVVAPRGGANQGGDGAGPGNLFDLQNVQVLKGPQGTLFGRNTSGGAVLLVPVKPRHEFEGYVEGSYGKLDMRRIQAVLNVPVMDSLRIRVGVDHNKRDGYLRNLTQIGPRKMANVDYLALRFSAVADLSDSVENYTIVSYTKSDSSSSIPSVKECAPGVTLAGIPVGDACVAQVARDSAAGFWAVENINPDAGSSIRSWQVINTTTWDVSDSLRVKNIFSYAEFRATNKLDFFGNIVLNPGVTFDQLTSPSQAKGFVFTFTDPLFGHTNAMSSLIEELQFQGNMADGRLTWQAGLYYEKNSPLEQIPYITPQFTPCADASAFQCTPATPGVSLGSGTYQNNKIAFEGMAAYAQASYDLTEQLKVTAGIRYTHDKTTSDVENGTIRFAANGNHTLTCNNATAANFGTPTSYLNRVGYCRQDLKTTSDAPTWTLGLDYKPIPDVLLYAKWTRGYRQGSINPPGPGTLQVFAPEKIDTYEVGTKAAWRGAVPGSFNLSGFYSDFTDQQLQLGVSCLGGGCSPTTAIVNAGKSRIYGLETELTVRPFRGLRLNVAYSYLNSKLQEVVQPTFPPGSIYDEVREIDTGVELPLAMPHSVTASAAYTLPLSEDIGRITFAGTFIYESRHKVGFAATGTAERDTYLPGSKYGNVNVTWENVVSMPVDLTFFVTNVTNEKRYAHLNDQISRGFRSYFLHEPRLWGVRVKYRFGALAD